MKTSAAGAAAILAGKSVVFAAGAKRKLKIALIGCGGRGNGALDNCMEAATNIDGLELELVATADWFKQKAESTGGRHKLPASKCFGGGNAYKELLETNADVVLIATSPNFRPVHFEAAVKAVIDEGYRTGDIFTGGEAQKKVGTAEMGDAIVERI